MSDAIYSISRLDTINRCMYEAYRTYVLNERGSENIYTILGSGIHECLENIVKGAATEADLITAMQDDLENVSLCGYEFPKDMKGEDTIRENWIVDMTHFCNNYKSPKKKGLKAETQVMYTSPKGYKLQGYVDLIWEHENNLVDIFDYKTSSMYTKDGIKEHGRQLMLYALALEQQGYVVRSISWMFAKYVDVSYIGYKTSKSKEKTQLTKTIERRKIGKELSEPITTELKDRGYDELDIELIIDKLCTTNLIPEEVEDVFKVRPCVVEFPLSEENRQDCIDYIESTIEMWESVPDLNKSMNHRNFTRTQKNGKVVNDIYYCTSLCPHNKECPYLSDFMDQLNKSSDVDDLF